MQAMVFLPQVALALKFQKAQTEKMAGMLKKYVIFLLNILAATLRDAWAVAYGIVEDLTGENVSDDPDTPGSFIVGDGYDSQDLTISDLALCHALVTVAGVNDDGQLDADDVAGCADGIREADGDGDTNIIDGVFGDDAQAAHDGGETDIPLDGAEEAPADDEEEEEVDEAEEEEEVEDAPEEDEEEEAQSA